MNRKVSSTNFENEQTLHSWCAAAYTLSLISGRWKLSILVSLQQGNDRFSALKAAIPAITDRILALQLKGLEQDGLICRQEQGTSAVYVLSVKGQALAPVIGTLACYGSSYRPDSPDAC